MSLRAYLWYARLAFQRRTAYRLANWSGIAVNFFFFLIHAQVYLAFFGARPEVAGWSARDAVLYFATSESLLMTLGVMSSQVGIELAERIRLGDVVLDLARPVRLWARALSEAYGNAAYYLLARTVVLYGAAVLLYRLAPPARAELVWLPLSLALAVGIAALLLWLAAATAFWWEHAQGPIQLVILAGFLFGGIVVPLDFYPDAVRPLADLLPFRGAIYTPLALATGKLAGGALLFGLAHQALWLALLALAARGVEGAGTRRLALLGG